MDSSARSTEESLQRALNRVAELESLLQVAERNSVASNEELQHFVYAASHDLQEPLRAVTTYSQLLERLYADDAQAHELTSFITAGVARMNALLHSLLTYSRMNLSPILSNTKLDGPLQSATYKLAALVRESGAQIIVGQLPEVPAYDVQVSQLFEQLITNAILFRKLPPKIEISAAETEFDGETFQLVCVKDNGVGIEPQFLPQVIQPFKRLHGKEVPGNGLGLAICEKIMRAHKGKFWLESDGSTGTQAFAAFPI